MAWGMYVGKRSDTYRLNLRRRRMLLPDGVQGRRRVWGRTRAHTDTE